MKNNNIQLISSCNPISNEYLMNSIFNTYEKISKGLLIEDLSIEDIKIIENFYSYLTLEGAKGMLNENAKIMAYEEMKKYVGNHFIYSNEMKRVFLNKYMELLEYRKVLSTEINQESSLKLA